MPNPTKPGEAIAGQLLATSAVTALIGNNVFPSKPNQDATGNYAVYYTSASTTANRLDGVAQLRQYTVRIECYATTEQDAEAILQAAVSALDGWSDPTIGVMGCFAQEDRDEIVQDDATGDSYQVSGQSFGLWFRPIPN